eukprot:1848850-Amphidinium_carterae.1
MGARSYQSGAASSYTAAQWEALTVEGALGDDGRLRSVDEVVVSVDWDVAEEALVDVVDVVDVDEVSVLSKRGVWGGQPARQGRTHVTCGCSDRKSQAMWWNCWP